MFDLKAFRNHHKLKQVDLLRVLKINSQSAISAYEGSDKEVPDDWIKKLRDHFYKGMDLQEFINKFSGEKKYMSSLDANKEGDGKLHSDSNTFTNQAFRSKTHFADDIAYREYEMLPESAQAGYLDAHIESQVMPELKTMIVVDPQETGHFKVIEIVGDSMNFGEEPIKDGDYILAKLLEKDHWRNKLHIKNNVFILVTFEGIVCKQITKHDVETGIITCHSWNPNYKDYDISLADVFEIYYVKEIVRRKAKWRF